MVSLSGRSPLNMTGIASYVNLWTAEGLCSRPISCRQWRWYATGQLLNAGCGRLHDAQAYVSRNPGT